MFRLINELNRLGGRLLLSDSRHTFNVAHREAKGVRFSLAHGCCDSHFDVLRTADICENHSQLQQCAFLAHCVSNLS